MHLNKEKPLLLQYKILAKIQRQWAKPVQRAFCESSMSSRQLIMVDLPVDQGPITRTTGLALISAAEINTHYFYYHYQHFQPLLTIRLFHSYSRLGLVPKSKPLGINGAGIYTGMMPLCHSSNSIKAMKKMNKGCIYNFKKKVLYSQSFANLKTQMSPPIRTVSEPSFMSHVTHNRSFWR